MFRHEIGPLGVLLASVLALAGCGDDSGSSEAGADGSALSFSVDGRGSSDSTSGLLQVWENEPIVEFSLRGVDAADNQVLFYVTFTDGVESVAGAHSLAIGLPGETNVFGIGVQDDQVYYSLRGQLDLTMFGDGRAEGEFAMDLAFDDGSGPPPGVASDAIESSLELSGAFRSAWTVDCRTRLVGFTGGHYTHASPYCQGLTF
jgi:hypothetical protein